MSYDFGDVVLVRFPFTNQQGSKPRPAAVVSNQDYNRHKPDVILAAITSQVRSPLGFGEVLVQNWETAGMLKPSVLKPVLFTAEQTILARTLGRLSAEDQKSLKQFLQQILG